MKAAQIALHHSLAAELRIMSQRTHTSSETSPQHPEAVRTVLVTPGQLTTSLFSKITPPSRFFGPPVTPTAIAKMIIKKVDSGTNGEISLPLYAQCLGLWGAIPAGLREMLRRYAIGMDDAAWTAYNEDFTRQSGKAEETDSRKKII